MHYEVGQSHIIWMCYEIAAEPILSHFKGGGVEKLNSGVFIKLSIMSKPHFQVIAKNLIFTLYLMT